MNRRAVLAAAAGALIGSFRPSPGVASGRARTLNVRDFGALGDGQADDTGAIQATINALPRAGGTVTLPSGTYQVDAERSLLLRSGVRLRLADGAVMRAKPNAAVALSAMIKAVGARDIEITGGTIVGERLQHRGLAGEWGMGILLLEVTGARLSNLFVQDCWGDGICVASSRRADQSHGACENIAIEDCTLRNNRRQGISIVASRRTRIARCVITETHGTYPQSGIDVEPDAGDSVDDVTIEDCTLARNQGYGLLFVAANGRVSGARAVRNRTERNELAGIRVHGPAVVELADNDVAEDRAIVLTEGATDVVLRRNRCRREDCVTAR